MTASRTAQLALLVSVITLALVAFFVLRPQPEVLPPAQSPQPTQPVGTAALAAELAELRVDVTTLQQSVIDTQSLVRAVLERGGSTAGSPSPGGSDAVARQLDRLEASIAEAAAKLDAICGAIQSSPFAPSGFNCP